MEQLGPTRPSSTGAQRQQLTITLAAADLSETKRLNSETTEIVDSASLEPSAPILSGSVRQPNGWPQVQPENTAAEGLETRYGFSIGQCPPLDHDDPSQLVRMMGYLVANQVEDWLFVADVCQRADMNDMNRKEAAKALRRELKYSPPECQLSAAKLWAIMLDACHTSFAIQCGTRKFLEVLETLICSASTAIAVRDRLLEVLAGAAFASLQRSSSGMMFEQDGYLQLWRRVKEPFQPDGGIALEIEDWMYSPTLLRPSSTTNISYDSIVIETTARDGFKTPDALDEGDIQLPMANGFERLSGTPQPNAGKDGQKDHLLTHLDALPQLPSHSGPKIALPLSRAFPDRPTHITDQNRHVELDEDGQWVERTLNVRLLVDKGCVEQGVPAEGLVKPETSGLLAHNRMEIAYPTRLTSPISRHELLTDRRTGPNHLSPISSMSTGPTSLDFEVHNAPAGVLQSWLDAHPEHPLRPSAIQRLINLTSQDGKELPTFLFIGGVSKDAANAAPVAGGSVADVFRGLYQGQDVAIKRFRLFLNQEESRKLYKRFFREAVIWRQLRHANILSFLGVDQDALKETNSMCMISPWMTQGTLMEYLRRTGPTTVVDQRRLIMDIAFGLSYLHSQPFVHGDLHGSNVFINEHDRALLGDFGLTAMEEFPNWAPTTTINKAGAVRWISPELIAQEDGPSLPKTAAGDIFAFGRICLAVFTRLPPWSKVQSDFRVLLMVVANLHPTEPSIEECYGSQMPDGLWDLICSCWRSDATKRPHIGDIISVLETLNF